MEDIDPCRWCGGVGKIHRHRSGGSDAKDGFSYQVFCHKCRARGPIEYDELEAISTWNRGRC